MSITRNTMSTMITSAAQKEDAFLLAYLMVPPFECYAEMLDPENPLYQTVRELWAEEGEEALFQATLQKMRELNPQADFLNSEEFSAVRTLHELSGGDPEEELDLSDLEISGEFCAEDEDDFEDLMDDDEDLSLADQWSLDPILGCAFLDLILQKKGFGFIISDLRDRFLDYIDSRIDSFEDLEECYDDLFIEFFRSGEVSDLNLYEFREILNEAKRSWLGSDYCSDMGDKPEYDGSFFLEFDIEDDEKKHQYLRLIELVEPLVKEKNAEKLGVIFQEICGDDDDIFEYRGCLEPVRDMAKTMDNESVCAFIRNELTRLGVSPEILCNVDWVLGFTYLELPRNLLYQAFFQFLFQHMSESELQDWRINGVAAYLCMCVEDPVEMTEALRELLA